MDRYLKKKKIGEGSFGTAFLVQSKADGKNYVIKEINISKMKRKEKEEAKKEVSVLRKMKHPNIVSYTESFEEVGNLYIVMDYCDGGDLYQQINARRGVLIQEDKIMDWFVQICLALKHVHDRKILHRDIKSQNIFLTSKGIIKMGDFGIARVLNNTMELARTCIGTPYYLSPEICENKPYNNKSDMWALGCVLYELCTLKHAFEAGNMKNLVLKIIRGSYPPVSPRYSYDLRNLVNQLFKRNPRDRPSVNTILKKNFIMKRIRKYLTDAQLQDEFNNTSLPIPTEGHQPPRISAAVKRPAERVSEGVRISAPAAKYGAPMRRKPPAGRRPPSADKDCRSVQSELEQKNRDLVAKEKQRRQKELHFKAQKQKLAEKQKLLQIQKAREAGWKNTLSSNGSSGGSGGGGSSGGGHEHYARPMPQPKVYPQPAAGNRGNYDHYHQYLDNLNARQKVDGGVGNVALFRQDQNMDTRRRIQERPVSASAAEAARRAEIDRNIAANAADRAVVVSEFLARKRQAEANKQRAGIDMGWYPPESRVAPDRPQPHHPSANGGDADYLEKLKAVRMQNFKERQMLQQRLQEGKAELSSIEGPKMDADARRKKIEALKAQADERAAKLKEQLEKQRREMFEREQKQWQEHLARKRNLEKEENAKNIPVEMKPLQGPAGTPDVSVTGVLQDVGANVKPAGPPRVPSPAPEVIKEKPRVEVPAERKKWGGGDGNNVNLADLPLQETASKMEATTTADVVTKYDNNQTSNAVVEEEDTKQPVRDQPPRKKWLAPTKPVESSEPTEDQAVRKKWNAPGGTVVGLLQNAAIQPMTMTIAKSSGGDIHGSPLGITVVKKKGSFSSKTIVIKEGDQPDKPAAEPSSPQPDSNGGPQTDSTTGGIDESDTSTHTSTPTEEETSADSSPSGGVDASPTGVQRDGSGPSPTLAMAVDGIAVSGVVSAEPSSQKGNKDEAVLDKPFVPPIRPMSAPTSNRQKAVEKTELSTVEEDNETNSHIKGETFQSDGKVETGESMENKENLEIGDIELKIENNVQNDGTVNENGRRMDVEIVATSDHSKDSLDDGKVAKTQQTSGDSNSQDKKTEGKESVRKDKPELPKDDSAKVDKSSENKSENEEERVKSEGTEQEARHEDEDDELLDIENAYREALARNEDSRDEEKGSSSDSLDESKEADKSVITGLTVGSFDADSRLLRTCSLPDLSKLFRTTLAFNPFFEVGQQVLAPTEDVGDSIDDDNDNGNVSDDEGDDVTDRGEANEDEDDEEAYQSMVESMKHLLEAVDGTEQTDENGSPEPPPSYREESSPTGDEDGEDSKPINEDWDSGEGSYDDDGEEDGEMAEPVERRTVDDEEESESVFLRLEESRMELEHELGCDNFLRAYKAVQAIHEDEDENIEEGTALVQNILGSSKQHLYTKILQLVMADGAYTEDNE